MAWLMRIEIQMNIGLTISRGRVSPCFSGVSLFVLGPELGMQRQEDDTGDWHALDWACELAHRNVRVLLCAGIDRFLWGALQGNGIEVVPDATGPMDEVVAQWREGKLVVPQMWPPQRCGGGQRGSRGRKGRRGR